MEQAVSIIRATFEGGLIFYIIYFVVNIMSFFVYVTDKLLAKLHTRRISEKALITVAALGPIGALLSMGLVRHKTKHIKFIICVPLFTLIHIALYTALLIF